MANPEVNTGIGQTPVVPEAPKVGLGVAPVVERAPVGQVGGLRPAVESPVLGAQPVAPVAQEVQPAPVVK